MKDNPFTVQRKQNIQTLKEIIRENQPIKHDKALALMGMYGITERTVASYLEVLQNAEFIVYDSEGKSWSMKK